MQLSAQCSQEEHELSDNYFFSFRLQTYLFIWIDNIFIM